MVEEAHLPLGHERQDDQDHEDHRPVLLELGQAYGEVARQKPDGSWWQNTQVDGTPHWTSLQMDEVSLPIVLAWWLGRTGAADWPHIQRAADFVVANGPKTGQERWMRAESLKPSLSDTALS